MKASSRFMYMIGFVFNIVAVLVLIGALILFGIAYGSTQIIQQAATESGQTFEFIKQTLLIVIIALGVYLLANILLIILIFHARKNLTEGNGRKTTHTIVLVVGILDANLFYLLGGVFGLVAARNDCDIDED